MNEKNSYLYFIFFMCLFVFEVQSSYAQNRLQNIKFNYGLDYTSGSYGEGSQTEIIYSPVSISAEYGLWSVSAVVPWLKVNGPVLILDGADFLVGTEEKRSGQVSGLGDISWKLMYAFKNFYDFGVYVDLSGRIKIPTASFSDGLGTGKLDASFQIDVAKGGGSLVPFFTIGKKWVGSPDSINLNDVIFATLGLQFDVSEEFTAGILYDYRESSIRDNSDLSEGIAYINLVLNDRSSVNFYGILGFSNNSPGKGLGINFTYHFRK